MKQRKPQVNKARVSTNMMRARVILRGVLSRRISENRPLASRQPATAPLSITCRTPQAVKTVLSLVATLLLLIATRSPIFSGTFTDVTGSAGLHGAGFTFGNPIWGDFDGDLYA
jgi:hypothetical protein